MTRLELFQKGIALRSMENLLDFSMFFHDLEMAGMNLTNSQEELWAYITGLIEERRRKEKL